MKPTANQIICGNNIDVVKSWPANCIDGICTDPPYGLGFMGKEWDTFKQETVNKPKTAKLTYKTDYIKGVPVKRNKPEMVTRDSGARWAGSYDLSRNSEFQQWFMVWAKAMLRITKPGGFLLCFGGTRTYHRLACAIEDAGWEIRDCMMWLYGCLSEDTEILTKKGWKPLHKTTKYDKIKVYDIANNIYKWETPQRWNIYRVHKDTTYRIKSDTTDQIVSKEHHCLVEREGKLVFKQAWELSEMENVPVLPQDFHSIRERFRNILFLLLQWKNKSQAFNKIFSKRSRKEASRRGTKRSLESCLERGSNLLQKERKLRQIQNKIRQVSQRIFGYGSQRWLRYGTSPINRTATKQTSFKNGSGTSYRPQPRKQFSRKSSTFSNQQSPQITRGKISKIEYSGLMFCPTVSTGAFIARRKGKVFITGNSGFPKSHNISKAIDKAAGAKRKVIGTRPVPGYARSEVEHGKQNRTKYEFEQTSDEASTPLAEVWNGYGTALKPAWEPIIVAMKPLDGTFAHNAKRHGVAGLNIDGGRIQSGQQPKSMKASGTGKCGQSYNWSNTEHDGKGWEPGQGRWPANLLLGEDVAKGEPWKRYFYCSKTSRRERDIGLDKSMIISIIKEWKENNITKEAKLAEISVDMDILQKKGISESGTKVKSDLEWNTILFGKNTMEKYQQDLESIIETKINSTIKSQILNWLVILFTKEYMGDVNLLKEDGGNPVENVKDCNLLKITTNEKMASLLGVKNVVSGMQLRISVKEKGKKVNDGRKTSIDNPYQRGDTIRTNTHPTVKPLALMKYLCTLLKMPSAEQIILDPFLGSGTTGMACASLGIDFIGIEKEPDYCEIASKRITAISGKSLPVIKNVETFRTATDSTGGSRLNKSLPHVSEHRQRIIDAASAVLRKKA